MLDGHLWVEVAGVSQKGPGCGMQVAQGQLLAVPHMTWAIPGRPHPVSLHVLVVKMGRPSLPCSIILRVGNLGGGSGSCSGPQEPLRKGWLLSGF